ncbi:MAG: putative intracellular protease/amidase [Paraglaciecola psychrophila]|jgi:putative intracellular protease/amidase
MNYLVKISLSLLMVILGAFSLATNAYADGAKRVLIVMSSESAMGISGKITGTWFEEVATPYYDLRKSGYEVIIASLNGGDAPIDLLSMQAPFTTANTEKFAKDAVAMHALQNTHKLSEINHNDFDALFFPSGYGLLWDDDELDLSRHLLFSLEDMLKARGANYQGTKVNWEAHIEIDGPLMTEQNPASALVLAKALAKRLN